MPLYLRVSPQIQVNHLSWNQGKRGIAYNRLMKKQVIQKKLGTSKCAQRSPQQQMLDSNHAGHPDDDDDDDDDDEWQTTFSSWDRYGKIVVDFSPVLSITYLSTETWHGNSNFKTTATCIIQRNARPKERYRNETHLQKKITDGSKSLCRYISKMLARCSGFCSLKQ